MVIKKITLDNFRMFKHQSVEFSTDPAKNMTIVLGENTYGKTTFVNAFIWCLYGDNRFKRGDKALLNKDVADALKPGKSAEVKVTLELSHNNFDYVITTTENYKKKNDGSGVYSSSNVKTSVERAKSGTGHLYLIDDDYASAEINSILRAELRDYFFFDGENNKVQDVATKGNLQEAVLDILNRKRIQDIQDLFSPTSNDSIIVCLRNELVADTQVDLLNGDDDVKTKLDNTLKDINDLETKIKATEDEIKELSAQVDEKKAVRDSNIENIELNEKKKKLEQQLDEGTHSVDSKFNDAVETFNIRNSLLSILFDKSFKKFEIKKMLDNTSFNNGSSYVGITADGVDDLINKGYCICGAKIEAGSEVHKHLIEAKNHMEPKDYASDVKMFVSAEESCQSAAAINSNTIKDIAGRVGKTFEEIDKTRNSLNEVKSKLAADNTDYSKLEGDIDSLNRTIGGKQSTIDNFYNVELAKKKKECLEYQNKLAAQTKNNEHNNFIYRCIDYLNCIYDAATKNISKSNEEIRLNLQDEVQKIFDEVFHGTRKIEIDDKLNVKLHEPDGTIIGTSTGLDIVSSFSFVIGLMNLAKLSLSKDNNSVNLMSDDPADNNYPLVLDAPFSDLDDIHIKNLCEAFAKYANQTIIFVKTRDFNSVDESLYSHIGKKYIIEQVSDVESAIRESN